VFPTGDGRANVGYGEILRDTPLSRAHLEQRLHALLPDARPTGLRAHRLPLSTGRIAVAHGRVLLVGDAAALINPLTGEGIFYAVASGALAGAAAIGPDPAGTYERALRARLGRHLRHTDFAAVLTRTPRMIDAAVTAAGRDQRVFDTLVDLGLGDGLLDPHSLLRTVRHLLPR
jgi:flavin-dependent dehydrogenase